MNILQEFEKLLASSFRFNDSLNPKAKYGTYKKAAQIFKNQQFYLFAPAQSAINRGRRGLGQLIEAKDV